MNQPIRVLNLFTIMNCGGAETMVMNYYRNIDRTKVQFDFMVHRQERGAYDDEIEALGGKIYRMPPISPITLISYRKELHDFFSQHKEYRILHSHMSELGYFVFREAQKWGIPVRICHAHSTPVFFSETFSEKVKRMPREILARMIRRESTDFFACSRDSGLWLFGKKRKFIIMKNAIDTSRFMYRKEQAELLKRSYMWDNKFIVGHVGRFCSPKNHSFLIDIFYEIQKDKPNSILLLFGDGELKKQIQNKVNHLELQDKVQFMGVRSDIYNFYQVFDVFIFPSFFEGFGNVLLEAQTAGVMSFTSKDVVPLDVCVSPLLKYIPLSYSAKEWKDIILSEVSYDKKNMAGTIVENAFDIKENASWLCDFYLKKYHQYE